MTAQDEIRMDRVVVELKWFWLILVVCSALTLLIQALVYLLG